LNILCLSIEAWATIAVDMLKPRLLEVRVTEEEIIAYLVDGRTISVPIAWSWRLSEATPQQRSNFEIIGNGLSIHEPDIDEDISVEGMLHGAPARRPKNASRRQVRDISLRKFIDTQDL